MNGHEIAKAPTANKTRNLTDGQKWELAQDKKEILLEKGRENLKYGGLDKKGLSIVDKGLEKHNTREEIAKDLG